MPSNADVLPVARPAPFACPVPLLRARDVPHAARLASRGELVSVVRGVYSPTASWRPLLPWDRYLARIHATILAHPGLVLSHESAAAIWGMPVLGDPGVVHALGDPTRTSRLHAGLRLHTTTGARDVVDLGGFAAVAPSDCAVDLARARHVVVGLIAADAALRLDPAASVESLVEQNEQRPSSRGRRIARWPLHRARAEAESTLESASRAIIELLGYEEPELQTEWSGPAVTDRTDFWWPGSGIAGEADGDLKYDGRFGDPVSLLRAASGIIVSGREASARSRTGAGRISSTPTRWTASSVAQASRASHFPTRIASRPLESRSPRATPSRDCTPAPKTGFEPAVSCVACSLAEDRASAAAFGHGAWSDCPPRMLPPPRDCTHAPRPVS